MKGRPKPLKKIKGRAKDTKPKLTSVAVDHSFCFNPPRREQLTPDHQLSP